MSRLNKGGQIGALLPLAIAIVISVIFGGRMNEEAFDWFIKATIAAIVTCGLLGNFLWGRFAKPEPKPPRDRQILP
jgi:hypothetical protein